MSEPHRVAWEIGNSDAERYAVDMPSEHYAELWADKLRSVGTSRVVVTCLPAAEEVA